MTGAGQVDGPVATPDYRTCTCHPDDNPPRPCPKKYALQDCRYVALLREVEGLRTALKKYGNHVCCDKNKQMPMEPGRTYWCPTDFDAWRDAQACTCGFDAALSPASGGV